MTIEGVTLFLILTIVLWSSLSIQIYTIDRENYYVDKNQNSRTILLITTLAILFISIKYTASSLLGLKTDWEFINGIFNYISLAIIYLGYKAINIEIESRREERAMRKAETLFNLFDHVINKDFWDNHYEIIDLDSLGWIDILNKNTVRKISAYLSIYVVMQQFIDDNILEYEYLRITNGYQFARGKSAVRNFMEELNKISEIKHSKFIKAYTKGIKLLEKF